MYVSDWHCAMASAAIKRGEVIAYPTEGLWGLGCDWMDDAAQQRILALKQRPANKGMIVLCRDLNQIVDHLQPLTLEQYQRIQAPMYHPTTWLLPCKSSVSTLLRGQHNTIAVRMSDHPVVQALVGRCGPIVSTSANVSGRAAAMSALKVRRYFSDQLGQQLSYIMPGELGGVDGPSHIRTLDGQRLR